MSDAPPVPETLKCSRCGIIQPVEQFYKTTNYWTQSRGRTYVCITCSRKSARESRAKRKLEDRDEPAQDNMVADNH
jgi:hypothetical protein